MTAASRLASLLARGANGAVFRRRWLRAAAIVAEDEGVIPHLLRAVPTPRAALAGPRPTPTRRVPAAARSRDRRSPWALLAGTPARAARMGQRPPMPQAAPGRSPAGHRRGSESPALL